MRDNLYFLKDLKEYEGNFTVSRAQALDRIMQFFVDANNPNTSITDLEKPGTFIAEQQKLGSVYNDFGWDDSDKAPYDVINSFWTTFVNALINYSDEQRKNGYREYWIHFSQSANWSGPLFGHGTQTLLSYATFNGLSDISKKTYATKVLNPMNLQYNVINHFKNTSIGKVIQQFASLSHSIANFMPCPDGDFNSARGPLSDAKDYLPLMIDIIQSHKESTQVFNSNNTIIKCEQIDSWHTWFLKNREKAFLQDYYFIEEDKRLVGIPLFDGQSLSHPVPLTEQELTQCLAEMIRRIQNRALAMATYCNDKEDAPKEHYTCPDCGQQFPIDGTIPPFCDTCIANH